METRIATILRQRMEKRMKWRIKKKKVLIETASYRKIKELIKKEMEEEAAFLEKRAENVVLPEKE